jgi:riboflavin biosynthesis protein ribD
MSKEAVKMNEVFIKNMIVHKPFIAVKLAQSLDGCTASRTGKSKWITNDTARQEGHYLRSLYDAILVGINTVESDNPLLTSRTTRPGHEGPKQPTRIILDSTGRIDLQALLVTDKQSPTIIVTTERCPESKRQALNTAGVEVIVAAADDEGRIDLNGLMDTLYKKGICSILIEGGSTVIGSFFDENLVDKLYVFTGHIIMGGKGKSSVGGKGINELSEAPELEYESVAIRNNNIFIEAYVKDREGAYVHWNH